MTTGIASSPNPTQIVWGRFNDEITRRTKALDEVISVLEREKEIFGVSLTKEKVLPNSIILMSEYWLGIGSHDITTYDVSSHYHQLVLSKILTGEIQDERDIWNLNANLLRYLKRFKADEAVSLLSYEEQKLGNEFINRLKNPPKKYNY